MFILVTFLLGELWAYMLETPPARAFVNPRSFIIIGVAGLAAVSSFRGTIKHYEQKAEKKRAKRIGPSEPA